jgi:hypothetical protein
MLLRFPCGGIVRCNGLFDGSLHDQTCHVFTRDGFIERVTWRIVRARSASDEAR